MNRDSENMVKYRASLAGMNMKKLDSELTRKRDELDEITDGGRRMLNRSDETRQLKAEIEAICHEIRERRGKAGPVENRQRRG